MGPPMEFEIKHLFLVVVIICGFWTLSVSSIKGYEEFTDKIEVKSELSVTSPALPFKGIDSWEAVVRALNIALPAGVISLALLLLTYSNNPVGILPLLFAGVLFAFGVSGLLETMGEVERAAGLAVAGEVWWMS